MLFLIIDTRTKESIENSLAEYLNISALELYTYIERSDKKAQCESYFNVDLFREEVLSIVSNLSPQETIGEMYVYHLSRRLLSDDMNNSSDNLKVLLTNHSPLSVFLKKHGITFYEQDGHIEILYKGRVVDLSNTSEIGVPYLRSRLGYIAGREDYCFNGFALKDQLMKNNYTRNLYRCPEFIGILASYLKKPSIVTDYFENSRYFCYTYKLKLSDVLFDTNDKFTDKEKVDFFIVQLFERLREYTGDSRYIFDHENPILRTDDNFCVSADSLIEVEEITADMIK